MRNSAGRRQPPQAEGGQISFIGDLCSAPSLFLLVLLAELLALGYTVLQAGVRQFDFLLLAYASLFLLWSALGAAALLCRLRPLFDGMAVGRSAGLSFVLALTWVTLMAVVSQWLWSASAPRGRPMDWWWVLDTAVVAAIVIGIGLRYAYLSLQVRQRQQSALHARLDALQSRIRPHFLFNTLNSISSLIAVDPNRAEQAVEDLAELFRANLDSDRRLVPWARERKLCESYLRIEQNRLGPRLQLVWREAPVPDSVRLPPLILQPLLENAILHGIQPRVDGGELAVDISATARQLSIVVINPLAQQPGRGGHHLGNDNIRQRLQTLFGQAASLTEEQSDGEYKATLIIPVQDSGQ